MITFKPSQLMLPLLITCGLLIGDGEARAVTHHAATIYGAEYVDLSHPGIHTHQNTIGFSLGRLSMPNAYKIQVTPHCDMKTNTWGYGPIEQWTYSIRGGSVYVLVPSRFVDAIYPFIAWAYAQEWHYKLDVTWDSP